MNLRLQCVALATSGNDTEGLLVFHADALAAVLVRLSADHGDEVGGWYLEVGFGRLETLPAPTFPNLDEAQDWILRRLDRHHRCSLTSGPG